MTRNVDIEADTGRTAPRPADALGEPAEPRRARARLWRFWRREDGAATVEFVIIFPVFISLFLASFELGLYMTRQVMLDRAVDISVRALRLGQFADPTPQDIRDSICARAGLVVANCDNRILIEMTRVPTTTWQTLPTSATCVNRDEEVEPVVTFNGGQPNDMMLIRVCALLEPVFFTTHLGLKMQTYGNFYALTATSAFVNEPSA
jgi:Flp pilus assembly protein TadG